MESKVKTEIREFLITVGVEFGNHESQESHPLGVTGNGFSIIEAPDENIARNIAFAIFERKWAFMYDRERDYSEEKIQQWHPDGEQLRIAWIDQQRKEALTEFFARTGVLEKVSFDEKEAGLIAATEHVLKRIEQLKPEQVDTAEGRAVAEMADLLKQHLENLS